MSFRAFIATGTTAGSRRVRLFGLPGPSTADLEHRRPAQERADRHHDRHGDGNTIDDCIYNAVTDTLCVRSERAGNEPACRTYTVTFTATDNCGLQTEEVGMTIHVPHDKPTGSSTGCLTP